MKSLFPKPPNMLLICIIDFLLQLKYRSSSLIKCVPIVGNFHLKYSTMRTKWLKVGMSDMQEWTEEVLESNKTWFLCFSLCMYIFYDSARKQLLQFWNLILFISILNFS